MMSPIPRDTPSLLVLEITFGLLSCTVHAVPNGREWKRNAGNEKGGNEQHYTSTQAHKTNKLFEKNNIQDGNKHQKAMHLI